MSLSPQLHCREIGAEDLDRIVDLLTTGYGIRGRDFWTRRIRRLSEYSAPSGFPKYGYLLDYNGAPVGVIFTIFSPIIVNNAKTVRCYLANWYVEPKYRSYAVMLASHAVKNKHVTYRIGTPIQYTLPILQALGYKQFCKGRFVSVPMLSFRSDNAHVKLVAPNRNADDNIQSPEVELLLGHARYGCISLTCLSTEGEYPFIFQPRLKAGVLPFARLVYCRDLGDFVRFAGPLGRFLIGRGFPLVVLDTNGPIPGLIGKYSSSFPKYFKGPDQPRLEDSTYSARVIFDF
jgi:hypothetical protein